MVLLFGDSPCPRNDGEISTFYLVFNVREGHRNQKKGRNLPLQLTRVVILKIEMNLYCFLVLSVFCLLAPSSVRFLPRGPERGALMNRRVTERWQRRRTSRKLFHKVVDEHLGSLRLYKYGSNQYNKEFEN